MPNALPLILAGVRSAANQVIATATVAGFVGLGTLGVFIFSASQHASGTTSMAGASIAVITLVLLVEACSPCSSGSSCRPGVRARTPRRLRRAATVPATLPTQFDRHR